MCDGAVRCRCDKIRVLRDTWSCSAPGVGLYSEYLVLYEDSIEVVSA